MATGGKWLKEFELKTLDQDLKKKLNSSLPFE